MPRLLRSGSRRTVSVIGKRRRGAPTRADGHLVDVYDRHGAAAFALCLAITGDRDRSADIVVACCRRCAADGGRDEGVRLLQAVRLMALDDVSAMDDRRNPAPGWLDPSGVLNDQQRQVLGLVYLRGLRLSEAAARLGVTVQETTTALAQAMGQLRDSAVGTSDGR
jgi:sigma-70-like protein